MAQNPMHQFEVYKVGPEISLGNINLSFTNASLFMTISALLILTLLFFGTKKKIFNTFKNTIDNRNELHVCCKNDK